MNKIFISAAAAVLTAAFTITAVAQKAPSKDDQLKEIATLSNTKKPEDSERAYQMAKQLLADHGKEKDGKIDKVRTWVQNYRSQMMYKAVDGGKTADAFRYGKDILADTPDDTEALINLAYAGYTASTTPEGKPYIDEAIAFSSKAAENLEAGKVPKSFAPFGNKNEAIAYLYLINGSLLLPKDPKPAVANVYRSIQADTVVKKSALPYYVIASYYEDLYAKMSTELKAKTLSDDELKAETEKVNAVVDRMMDAYARACKRAADEKNPNLAAWKDRLATIYKFRTKMDTGLDGFIISAYTKPMPDPSK